VVSPASQLADVDLKRRRERAVLGHLDQPALDEQRQVLAFVGELLADVAPVVTRQMQLPALAVPLAGAAGAATDRTGFEPADIPAPVEASPRSEDDELKGKSGHSASLRAA
jgi:hypothetical protein